VLNTGPTPILGAPRRPAKKWLTDDVIRPATPGGDLLPRSAWTPDGMPGLWVRRLREIISNRRGGHWLSIPHRLRILRSITAWQWTARGLALAADASPEPMTGAVKVDRCHSCDAAAS
jgi:hypothetical protein